MKPEHDAVAGRTTSFARNGLLETLLKDLNASLWLAEEQILARYHSQAFPVVLLMGPMRSGTTLFMQWLANTGCFAYPTNLLSRFYQAPILGAKIQLLLTDSCYNFRDELSGLVHTTEYRSENGKTRGVLAPNEFWYFWRRFLAAPERDAWTDDELRRTFDAATMRSELAGLTEVFQQPFAAKGLLFNYNIPFLDSVLDKALFIQIRRDPVANVASVLDARKRQLGSEDAWYSFRIPEYERLCGLDAVTQVAGQVSCMNRAVTAGLRGVADGRKLVVDYEQFCANPRRVFNDIADRIGATSGDKAYRGPVSFEASRTAPPPNRDAIIRALENVHAS